MIDLLPNLANARTRLCRRLQATVLFGILAGLVALVAAPAMDSQTAAKPHPKTASAASSSASKLASVKSFRLVQEKSGPAVEILSTKPLLPEVQLIANPDRLVIDLPNARLETQQKRIDVKSDQITALRAQQFSENPPVARVVVDLQAPRSFTWDSAGNRLVVHLGKNPNGPSSSPFQTPTETSLTSAPQPVVASVRSSGPLVLTSSDGSTGSSVTAGADTTILKLSSGGEVHVCPGTTVSVTPSQNRHNLMFSMNTGAMEAHIGLDASSDSVMTPDFRILLVGPGEFHYAISADTQGNTCVRALPGNTASAMVSELLGDRTYQVKATDQLVFRSGQLDRVDMAVPLECGCPPRRETPMRASADLTVQSSPSGGTPVATARVGASPAPQEVARNEAPAATAVPPSPDMPAANELHVQVTAPFVFHAEGPPPPPTVDVKALPTASRAQTPPELAAPLPPTTSQPSKQDAQAAPASRPENRGFFHKIGGFFASLFR